MVGIAKSRGSNMRYPSEPLYYWILWMRSNKSQETNKDINQHTYEDAITSINIEKWQKAMNSEIDSVYSNKI